MPATEFRILAQIAIACLFMLPVGLLLFAPQRRLMLAALSPGSESTPAPYRMSWADLMAGLMLCGFLAMVQFAGKAMELSHPAKTEVAPLSMGDVLMSLVIIQGMQIGIVWAWFHLRQTSLSQVFGLRKYAPLQAVRTAAIMIVPAGITAMLSLILLALLLRNLGWPVQEQDAVTMLKSQQSPIVTVLLVLGACVGAPIVEELLFRGLLYGSLRNLTNKWFAAIFSALVFGMIHLHLPSFPALCLLGFFFAVAYEVTGSLTISILMHALFNGIQTVLAFYHGS